MDGFSEQEFFVEVDTGVRLMVRAKIPSAERLGLAALLVHGSGVGWVYWDIPIRNYSIMDYLAGRGIDVYAVECRGYGKSNKPNGMGITTSIMAADMKHVCEAVMRQSEVKRVSMVGHSSGGTVVLLAASMYPGLVDCMVVIGTPYKKISPQFMEYVRMVVDMSREPGKDYVPNLHYRDIEERLDICEDDVIAWYKTTVEKHYGLIPGGLFPDLASSPAAASVPRIKAPTLILIGSNEYVLELDDALAMYKDLGSADKSIIMLPGAYHLMFLEKSGHGRLQESLFFWITKK
ncbi:MAG: alpha/beta fold hydrolase [Deltaproteobacteria bacterium]|nr:alpha/beta fold hydrolase [Deltaproteobacteria bacterium]